MSLQRFAKLAKEEKKMSDITNYIKDKITKRKIEKGASRRLYKEIFEPVTTELQEQSKILPAITQQLKALPGEIGQEIAEWTPGPPESHQYEGIPQLFEELKAIAEAPKEPAVFEELVKIDLDRDIDPELLGKFKLPNLSDVISKDMGEMDDINEKAIKVLKSLGGKKGGLTKAGKSTDEVDQKIDMLREYNASKIKGTKNTQICMHQRNRYVDM